MRDLKDFFYETNEGKICLSPITDDTFGIKVFWKEGNEERTIGQLTVLQNKKLIYHKGHLSKKAITTDAKNEDGKRLGDCASFSELVCNKLDDNDYLVYDDKAGLHVIEFKKAKQVGVFKKQSKKICFHFEKEWHVPLREFMVK